MAIAEGLLAESEQFAATMPTPELRQGLARWSGERAMTRS
jgi:hypothetical protein